MSNQKASDVKIVSLEECEHDFLRDNEYIKHGYRVNFNSTGKILRSFFMYHNESVNVWSHLAGVLLFCFLLGYTVAWLGIPNKVSSFTLVDDFKSSLSTSLNDLASNAYRYESLIHRQISEIYKEVCILGLEFEDKVIDMYNKIKTVNTSRNIDPLIDKFKYLMSRIDSKEYDWIDIYNESYLALYKVSRWPIFVYIFSAMVCLGCSTVFHLFSAHSFKVNRNLSYLDYAGISILTSGSFYPPIYYAFYCYPCKVYAAYIYLYLGGISVASLITFIISFIPSFQSASMRWFRGTLFLILGLLGIIPLVHLLFLPEASEFYPGLLYFSLMAGSYITGVFIYIARVPERFYPGKFDFCGHSHNIWHLFVVLAAFFHYLGCLEVYHLRQHLICKT